MAKGGRVRTPGSIISGIGHLLLIIWLIVGWQLSHDPLDFEVTSVTVVSGEEFAALQAANIPDVAADTPPALSEPRIEEATPEVSAETDAAPEVAPPSEVTPPAEETPPAPLPEALPVTDVAEAPDQPVAQPEAVAVPDLPVSPRPQPRPADRVAPTPVAPPPPDANISDEVTEAAEPDQPAEAEVVEEPSEATSPEEAASEIVTEAETPSSAPLTSTRPQSRPSRPATPPTEATAEEPQPETDDATAAAVAAALASATSTPAPSGQSGPPMTGAETESFRIAVSQCWNVDVGSLSTGVTITVGFSLGTDGRVAGDVRLVDGSGGDQGAIDTAFGAARRAILRCQNFGGRIGYPLPIEKYDQWRDVEMTFDPSGMRLR